MQKIKAVVMNRNFLIGLAVGGILGVAYLVKSAMARKAASYLPGSATAPAPTAGT